MPVYLVSFSTYQYNPNASVMANDDCWQSSSIPFSSLKNAQSYCSKEAQHQTIKWLKDENCQVGKWIGEYTHKQFNETWAFRILEMEVDRGLND